MEKPLEDIILDLYRPGSYDMDSLLEKLEKSDPETAEELKRNSFVFEDLILLDDRAIQMVLREVDIAQLAKAMKACDAEVCDKIYRNMSNRSAELLKEDMDFLGPIKKCDIDESRMYIVHIILKLEEKGEIVIARGGEDETLVL